MKTINFFLMDVANFNFPKFELLFFKKKGKATAFHFHNFNL